MCVTVRPPMLQRMTLCCKVGRGLSKRCPCFMRSRPLRVSSREAGQAFASSAPCRVWTPLKKRCRTMTLRSTFFCHRSFQVLKAVGILGVLDPVKLRLFRLKRASEPTGDGRSTPILRRSRGIDVGKVASGAAGGRDGGFLRCVPSWHRWSCLLAAQTLTVACRTLLSGGRANRASGTGASFAPPSAQKAARTRTSSQTSSVE